VLADKGAEKLRLFGDYCGMAITNPAGHRARQTRRTLRPEAIFFLAVLVAGAALALSPEIWSRDAALPLAAALLFAAAALVAQLAWQRTSPFPHEAVTYRDVAGALVLIGIFAGAMVEPDQMLRLMQGGVPDAETSSPAASPLG
jgi:drug/metabolite transporter (DMT)-like permease